MKYLLAISFVLISLSNSLANDKGNNEKEKNSSKRIFQGSILDRSTGELLIGAKIIFTEEKAEIYTNTKGEFSHFGKQNSEAFIEIECLGYQSKKIRIGDFTNNGSIELLPL